MWLWKIDLVKVGARLQAMRILFIHQNFPGQFEGFIPDLIIAHPGWGESLFLKDVWPAARLGIYCELFSPPHDADVGFDPEFPVTDVGDVCRLRLKNLNNLLHFEVADAGLSPTHWQASTFPEPFRSNITVVLDGIDTVAVIPPEMHPKLRQGVLGESLSRPHCSQGNGVFLL